MSIDAESVTLFKERLLAALHSGKTEIARFENGDVMIKISEQNPSTDDAALRGIYNYVIYAELISNNKSLTSNRTLQKPGPCFSFGKEGADGQRLRRLANFEKERPLDSEQIKAAFRPALDGPKRMDLVMAAADKAANAASGEVLASPTVRGLVDYWRSLGLKVGRRSRDYEAAVHAVRDLLHGKRFQSTRYESQNRKFRIEEIKTAMDNFAKAALNDAYLPSRRAKRRIKGHTLPQFVYNPFVRRADQTKGDSQFLRYVQGPPAPASRQTDKDEFPAGTARLRNLYEQQALGGVKPRYNAAQEQALRFAVAMGVDFFQRNRKRLAVPHAVFGPDGVKQSRIAELLWEAMVRGGEPSRVRLVWFRNPAFYDHDFVSFLCGQGILEMEQHKRGRKDAD